MCNIIYGQFSAKATAKDIMIHYERNAAAKAKTVRAKNRESRRLEPNRHPVFDAAHHFFRLRREMQSAITRPALASVQAETWPGDSGGNFSGLGSG